MILQLVLPKDAKGKVSTQPSKYNPSKEVKERTEEVMREFSYSYDLMQKPFAEFNDMSVLTRQDNDQKIWNNWQEPESQDPDEFWKSRAVRGIARNRAISVAAHVTGQTMVPKIMAQDDNNMEDKDGATVMQDLMEYANNESQYDRTFLYSVIAAEVNPATIIHTEYRKSMRTIKEIQEDGSWKEKIVPDEENTGFCDTLVPIDELFIGNIYEHSIQRQPYLIWRRVIDFSVAFQKYGDNENFRKFVRPGVQYVFSGDNDLFYEQNDDELEGRMVEEVIYYNRLSDLQLTFVNGVLIDHHDQPMKRKDKKYPFVKGGYELIDEGKFFYYVSLMNKMSKDVEIAKTLYRMNIDSGYMKLMPSVAIFGDEVVNSSVITPGTVNTFKETTKLEPINTGSDLNAGLSLLEKVEANLSESSNDVLQSGQSIQGSQTAFEISRLEQNARVMLGLFGKMIGFMVRDLGELRVGDILQYLTIGDVKDIAGEDAPLKFGSFLIPEKTRGGRTRSRKIEFDGEMSDEPMTREELEEKRFSLASDKKDDDPEIWKVNPGIFRGRKFRVVVTSDIVSPPSDNLKKVLNLEEFDRLIQLPFVDHEKVTKDLLLGSYEATKGNTDEYIVKQQPVMPQVQDQKNPDVMNKIFGNGQNQQLNRAVA